VDPAIADREVGAGAIAEALREQFTWLPPGEPIHSLLSGGWDSRLLLALAHERGDRPIRAWTVNNDVGHYEEERIAKIVTTELGIDHEIVPPRVGNFWEDWTETAALQDFQAPTRIRVLRLARLLRQQRGIALEGIAGDIFIKGLYVTEGMLDAPAWETTADLMWRRVFRLRRGGPLLERGFRERILEVARADFRSGDSAVQRSPLGRYSCDLLATHPTVDQRRSPGADRLTSPGRDPILVRRGGPREPCRRAASKAGRRPLPARVGSRRSPRGGIAVDQ
jgi:hypothetical protein